MYMFSFIIGGVYILFYFTFTICVVIVLRRIIYFVFADSKPKFYFNLDLTKFKAQLKQKNLIRIHEYLMLREKVHFGLSTFFPLLLKQIFQCSLHFFLSLHFSVLTVISKIGDKKNVSKNHTNLLKMKI